MRRNCDGSLRKHSPMFTPGIMVARARESAALLTSSAGSLAMPPKYGCRRRVRVPPLVWSVVALCGLWFSGSDGKNGGVPLPDAAGVNVGSSVGKGVASRHNNNWAVLICTSRFWFNYRHVANTLSVYHTIRRLGIPDSNIVLMLADDMPCNARNPFPGGIYNSKDHGLNLYEGDVEVDYRGGEVSVESFLRLLTGRTLPGTPPSKTLATDEHSNVLIYMNGHGGDQFLKFHDMEEVSSHDLGGALREMELKKRYHRVLFMVDTCQASTLFDEITSPEVLCVGSSIRGENSYARGSDPTIGLALMDRFTSSMLDFFQAAFARAEKSRGTETVKAIRRAPGAEHSQSLQDDVTLGALFGSLQPKNLMSTPFVELKGWTGPPLDRIPVTDFFASVLSVELTMDPYDLVGDEDEWEEEVEAGAVPR